ncbi:MAG: YlbF family regulator [Acutalibacteraceae bacterium]
MDIIELAREIGRAIQKEDCYVQLKLAQQQSDEDEVLQGLIGEFNLKRMAINNEATKADRDDEKLQALNAEMREVYSKIMQNENMILYNEKKQEMDTLLQRVLAIITQSADGEDPNTTDYTPSCGGSCSTCGGCH